MCSETEQRVLSPHLEIREPCRARLQRLGLRRREAALMLACDENLLCILLRGSARLAHVLESSRGLPFTHASHERAPKLWQGKLQRSSQRELPKMIDYFYTLHVAGGISSARHERIHQWLHFGNRGVT